MELLLNNFAENNVDSEGKLREGNHEEIDIGDTKEPSIDNVKTGQITLADCDKHEFQKDFHSDCLSDTKGWEQGQRLVRIV